MSTAANPEVLKLAPSDLTFTWDECQRCFWLKVRGVLRRPSSPFPKVFGRLDRQTKALYLDKSAQQLAPELPPGQVVTGGLSVRSSPLLIPGHETAIQIAGRIDTGLAFDDGSYGIIDFKLSTPNPAHVPFYARQLHAYMAAAESPAPGALKLSPISKLGLVVVEPERMVELDDAVAYRCAKHFLPIERDDDMFAAFLVEVLTVLERPEPPEPSPGCSYCTYLKAGSLVLMTEFYGGRDMSSGHPEGSTSLEELAARVSDAMHEGQFSEESAARLGALMQRFVGFARAGFAVEGAREVTPVLAESFVRARARDGASPAVATMHLRRATVRLLFSEGRRLGLADHDPTMDLRLPPRTSLRTRPLSDEEVALCRSFSQHTASETRQPAAWAFAETSARSTEIAGIRVRDLDLERSRVWIAGSTKTEARWGTLTPWGERQVLEHLERRRSPRADQRLICPRAAAGVAATSSASIAIAATLRRAGLGAEPDVRPPSVAAWAGASAKAAGASIEEVAWMLGIRSLDRAAAFIGFDWHEVEAQ